MNDSPMMFISSTEATQTAIQSNESDDANMAGKTLKSVLQLRHDTLSNWTSKNPILRLGEHAVETDTGRQKVGNGISAWNDLPYDVQVGGRNMLLNSGIRYSNSNYPIASYYLGEEKMVKGQTYTISVKGELAKGSDNFSAYVYNGNYFLCTLQKQPKTDDIYAMTFVYGQNQVGEDQIVLLYPRPNSGSISTIEWVKLEKGNIPTDWTPAPEDITKAINDAKIDPSVTVDAIGTFRYIKFTKTFNSSYPTYLLLADVSEWYLKGNNGANAPQVYFKGIITSYRNGEGYNSNAPVALLNINLSYNTSSQGRQLSTTSPYLRPMVISYNGTYYLALRMPTYSKIYEGLINTNIKETTFTQLLSKDIEGNLDGMSIVFDSEPLNLYGYTQTSNSGPSTSGNSAEWYDIYINLMHNNTTLTGQAHFTDIRDCLAFVFMRSNCYDESIVNNPDYRYALLRWKKTQCINMDYPRRRRYKKWAIPMLAWGDKSGVGKEITRELASNQTYWPVTGMRTPFYDTEGWLLPKLSGVSSRYIADILKTAWNEEGGKKFFVGCKHSQNVKFGVALFKRVKRPGKSDYWQRVSNIAAITLRYNGNKNNGPEYDIRYSENG